MNVPSTLDSQGQGYYAYRTGQWVPTDSVRVEKFLGERARLLEDIAYIAADGSLHAARENLVFDGGSKPHWSQPIVGHPWNEYLLSYAVHDQDCTDILDALAAGFVSLLAARQRRAEADRYFLEGMRWIKRSLLDRTRSRWERAKLRAKYVAVRMHARRSLSRRNAYAAQSVIALLAAALLSASCSSIPWNRLPDSVTVPIPKPPPASPLSPAGEAVPPGTVWLHTDVSAWPVTSELRSVSVAGGLISLDYDAAARWPATTYRKGGVAVNANPWILVRMDGVWYASAWEWMRPGQTAKQVSAVHGSHMTGALSRFRPRSGETYYFFLSTPARDAATRTLNERTNLLPYTWP